ncbi:iron ABC transporter substrate-binding protein [Candidatus Allofournierella excrementavium]|uniref:iron ABC transporter substrate-binding protein n=1 Tax=Candidatus Allofournierella excrementavium TaxID=2838591 RepID=UPI003AB5EB8D
MKLLKKCSALALALALSLSLAACADAPASARPTSSAPSQAGGTRLITDGAWRQVEVPETVESVVCVGVGALRYTCYMGAADRVVGVEDYENQPDLTRLYSYVNGERFKDLPVIGTNGSPNAEEIITVDPQVIVMSEYASADADELAARTGIPVVVVPGSDTTLDEKAYETLRVLGELFVLEERAEELTAYLDGVKDDLAARTASVPESERPSVYVAGVSFKGVHGFEGTEAHYGPFELLNANNLADTTGQSGAFDIDPEQVLAWDPDVIFLDFNGMDLINEDYAKNPDFYNALSAVKNGKVYSQISFRSYASNLDTALADAYYAGSVIYPEQFADVDPVEKAGEIFTTLLGENPYNDLKEAGYEFRPIVLGE